MGPSGKTSSPETLISGHISKHPQAESVFLPTEHFKDKSPMACKDKSPMCDKTEKDAWQDMSSEARGLRSQVSLDNNKKLFYKQKRTAM